ncbi:flagellar biosynthetic protein FliR [Solirubrobacter sp. CPCC 204708]|uniref:Flagellar biosynthetic protein FliR n=1 Tax=Solirubrobacter deserti TaxID=2282478 RepID=A0ABT4RME8_9ACTN|nr:flagellar biosynthetic protein FliR [Solirubrobacter deserti]MBE2316913.1 flagellar biosynthetic protein FliR [Solirubrobacter deserti]MDA0139744.1 flagellar biosynthetic protein FliR [Solirubrobacter deserti]
MAPEALLAHFSEQTVAAFFLVLARISPLFLLAPLFSSKMINSRVKGIVAVALAVGLMPVVKHGEIDLDVLNYAGLLVKELIVGLAFAYALHAMFAALQAAGTLLDTLIGFSFGAIVDPVTGTQSAVIQQMYSLFGVAIFVAIGGDTWVIKGMAKTYDAVPLLGAPPINSMVEGAQIAFSSIFTSAFMICAPVLIAIVIVDAAFGVVSKVVPQMNIFAVGFPAKMIVGLTLIGASLPFVSGFIADQLQLSVAQALSALGG